MILRKPYAFLARHFKAIHMSIFVLCLYILIRTFNLVNFLGNYIKDSGIISSVEDYSSVYVNKLFLFSIFLVIALAISIFFLLKHKHKPKKFYILVGISSIVLLFMLLYVRSFIKGFQFETPDIRFTKIVRDLFVIQILFQVPILITSFIRGIGLDIKKLEFKQDLLDLGISTEDNAEFEFKLSLDKDDINSSARKRLRYLKYIFLENKLIFTIIGGILALIIVIFGVKAITSIEPVYKENELVKLPSYNIKVLSTYKTNYNNWNEEIYKKYSYVIVRIRYTNTTQSSYSINTNNIVLRYGEALSTYPKASANVYFPEFGEAYSNQTITPGEARDFTFIYRIERENYNNSMKLEYLYDVIYNKDNKQVDYKYKRIKLSPKEFDEEPKLIESKKIGEELNFEDSLLGDTKLTIEEVDINNEYKYNEIVCKDNKCKTKNNLLIPSTSYDYDLTLMRIKYNLTLTKDLGKKYQLNSIFESFGRVKFVVNGKEYDSKIHINEITPFKTNGYAYIEVREKVNLAEKIYIDFTIRDKQYRYLILDKTKENNSKEEGTK